MAEVEKLTAAPPTDIPVSAPVPSPHASETGGGSSAAELGTSPTQEPSSNSHPHDSEYDTASDLEGGEDYDDDDIDDESISDEETETDGEDAGSETEDDVGSETVSGNDNALDRSVDSEAQKKVDEDRSNPQYIPKRGTFYEHDDRMAQMVADLVDDPVSSIVGAEAGGEANGVIAIGNTPGGQTPTISQASKTMKKWQPASGVERWSHDRFDASEQAPKSRAELLSAYGYDIRNEDAPPRARRRRRYGRGPMKYARKWEDEQAYLKASNKERKLPRPQDFPALNERKARRPRTSSFKEEKENRNERRSAHASNAAERQQQHTGSSGGPASGSGSSGPTKGPEPRERESEHDRDQKNRRYGRVNGGHSGGRQNAMEFKQKPNRGQPQRVEHRERERERERERDRDYTEREHQKPIAPRSNAHSTGPAKSGEVSQPQQRQNVPHQQHQQKQNQQALPQVQQEQQQQQPQQQQHLPTKQPSLTPSNLSQRLQQVQQRNDPSHVGSVQMHALASQNQQQQLHLAQQQQHQLPLQSQQQQQPSQQPQTAEQRNAPKRYSSLRRTQQEASQQQHLAEQQQLQQIQMQPPQPQSLLLQDPHMLMQLYQHQELQAQLQTLQLGPAPPNAVPQPPKQHGPAAAYPQAQGAAPYFVTAAAEPVPAAPYVNPTTAAYLPPTPAAVAYAQGQPAPPQGPPQAQAAPQAGQPPPSMNYHQNYNTVGGTTYFVPPAQTSTRPAVLPQRRPTNAIPILPPSEKHKARSGSNANANVSTSQATQNANTPKADDASIGSADNIDHIIDNMFVQRPAFQPPSTAASSTQPPSGETAPANKSVPASEDPNSNAVSPAPAEQSHQAVAVAGQE